MLYTMSVDSVFLGNFDHCKLIINNFSKHSLTAFHKFERHKKFVGDYILYYGGKIEEFRRSM